MNGGDFFNGLLVEACTGPWLYFSKLLHRFNLTTFKWIKRVQKACSNRVTVKPLSLTQHPLVILIYFLKWLLGEGVPPRPSFWQRCPVMRRRAEFPSWQARVHPYRPPPWQVRPRQPYHTPTWHPHHTWQVRPRHPHHTWQVGPWRPNHPRPWEVGPMHPGGSWWATPITTDPSLLSVEARKCYGGAEPHCWVEWKKE